LPWLCPNTDSLIGLAERSADLPRLAAADPAFLAFLLRFAPPPDAQSFSLEPSRFAAALLPDAAAAYLNTTPEAVLCNGSPLVAVTGEVSIHAAEFARRIAARTGRAPVEAAAVVARLAPLGLYAVGIVDPSASVVDVRALDHDGVARRLAARWRLPPWAGTVLGNLNLPLRGAKSIVADPDLFAVVQLALREAESRCTDLGISRGVDRGELLAHLGLSDETTAELFAAQPEPIPTVSTAFDPNPHRVPLVGNLLRMAAEACRRTGAALVFRYEERIDELHRAVAELAAVNAERLRDAKLAALAELAAGAGHEINNPLAVISGYAQRLLRTEMDDDRADALRAIVRQTQRVHSILRDLIQFARPSPPDRTDFPVSELVAAVREELAPLAVERQVRLDLTNPADVWIQGDLRQLRHAVASVVRNGIEAAGADGWVRLGVESPEDGPVMFVIEDSGPGMTPAATEHAFDPFYCGRSAGRGRGLGLPTAWRFARENGGDIRHEPTSDGVTRFVITCPRGTPTGLSGRLSA
jgi:signal transduction histidine kinase